MHSVWVVPHPEKEWPGETWRRVQQGPPCAQLCREAPPACGGPRAPHRGSGMCVVRHTDGSEDRARLGIRASLCVPTLSHSLWDASFPLGLF